MGWTEAIAAGGMRNLLAAQEVTANNLANASTSGFRRIVASYRNQDSGVAQAGGAPGGTPPVGAPYMASRLDPRGGSIEETGNPLDLALEGSGWLTVATPGGERLLRGGSFRLDADGRLCTREGWPLLDIDGAPIRATSADVQVEADGTVTEGGAARGRLRVVDADPAALIPEGGVMALEPGASVHAANAKIRQGRVETSNVEPLGEMVHMIETLRQFEFLQQTVRAADEMQRRAATDVGRLR